MVWPESQGIPQLALECEAALWALWEAITIANRG
jgi:hypothetical protein